MTATAYGSHQEVVLARVARLRRRVVAHERWARVTMWAGVAIIGIVVLLSLVAPLIGFTDPDLQDLPNALQPPSWQHLFGTDSLGRDIFTRVLYAGRVDLVFAVLVTYAGLALGLAVGAVSGYFGGKTDTVAMRVVDMVMAFPFLVIILAFVAAFGPGLTGAYVGLIAIGWAVYARLVRGEMLVVREQQYILAARTLGLPVSRIIFRHAVPNVMRVALVFSMADMVLAILVLSSLSYFGLGVQPPTAEWGAMVADGQTYLLTAWWVSTLPGLWIVLVGIGFSLLGDGLADRLGTNLRLAG